MDFPRFFSERDSPGRSSKNRVAVFVRTHLWDEKVQSLVSKLMRYEFNYDLYLMYDTTHACLPENLASCGLPDSRVLVISEQMCSEAGFYKGPGLVFYHCGDIALCYVMSRICEYDFYAMLDWDVDLTEGNEDFFFRLARNLLGDPDHPHFLGLLLHHCTWGDWYKFGKDIFKDEHSYYAYFPFILLSRSFLALVHAQRQLHECRRPTGLQLINGEMFVPSLAASAGFKMLDLAEYMPRAYDRNTIALNTGESGVGLPLEGVKLIASGEAMVHPVFTAEYYVERVSRKFKLGLQDEIDVAGLAKYLERRELSSLPPHLLASLHDALKVGGN